MGFYFLTCACFLLNTKSSLRQYYRDLRRRVLSPEKANASHLIVNHFLNYLKLQHSPITTTIGIYLAHDGEIDLQVLIERLWSLNYRLYLPVLDVKKEEIHFSLYTTKTPLKKNHYNIQEPIGNSIALHELGIVLMPLVAFDKSGARLGMGKGYYDRAFSLHNSMQPKPLRIGVAYACQCAESLPNDAWDIPLDGILTESELIFFGQESCAITT